MQSRQIKEIPILRGKSAKRFEKIINGNKNKKVSAVEYNRAIANYKKVIIEIKTRKRLLGHLKDYNYCPFCGEKINWRAIKQML